jgi:hypothetical protein
VVSPRSERVLEVAIVVSVSVQKANRQGRCCASACSTASRGALSKHSGDRCPSGEAAARLAVGGAAAFQTVVLARLWVGVNTQMRYPRKSRSLVWEAEMRLPAPKLGLGLVVARQAERGCSRLERQRLADFRFAPFGEHWRPQDGSSGRLRFRGRGSEGSPIEECCAQLTAPGDLELTVGVCEVVFDRLHGYKQQLRDLAVGVSGGGQLGHSQLAWCE